jgi:O-antigen ligase
MNGQKDYSYMVIAVSLAFIVAVAVIVPRALAFVPGIMAVVYTALSVLYFKRKFYFSRPVFAMVAAILLLTCLSSLWSIEPGVSLEKAGNLALILIPGGILINMALNLDVKKLAPYAWIVGAVFLAATFLLALELLLGTPFYRFLHGLDASHPVNTHIFNRGIVSAVLCFFPCLFLFENKIRPLYARIAFYSVIAALLLAGQSQSAQLALFFGILALAAFPYRRKKAWIVLSALIGLLILSAPFIAMWGFANLAPVLDVMPVLGRGGGYAGARLEVWDFISRYLMDSPLYGFGMEATRTIHNFDNAQIYQPGTSILHPHNFALQIWIEFGLIGAVAGAVFFAYLLRVMQRRLSAAQARIVLPAFAACLSAAAMSYGLWQSWWIGLLCFVAFLCIVAARIMRAQTSPQARNRNRS